MTSESHDNFFWRTLSELGGRFWPEAAPEPTEFETPGAEFSKMLYKAEGGQVLDMTVLDAEEESKALEKGFVLQKPEPLPEQKEETK